MIRVILFLLGFFSFSISYSQTELDSLNKAVQKYLMTNRDSFFKISDRIIYLLKESNSDSLLMESYLMRSMVYQLDKDFNNGLKYCDIVLQMENIPVKLKINAILGKAEMMWKLNYSKNQVLEVLDKAKEESIKINDSTSISSAYFRYSNLYISHGDYLKAIQVLMKSIEIRPQKLILPKVLDLAKLSKLFLLIGNNEKAEQYASEAFELALNNKYSIKDKTLAILRARIAVNKGEYYKADSLFNIALENYKKRRAKADIFNIHVYLADLNFKQNKISIARNHLLKANKYFNDVQDIQGKVKYYLVDAKINIKTNDFIKANNSFSEAKKIIDKANSVFLEYDYIKTRAYFEKKRKNYSESLMLTEEYHRLQDSLFKYKTAQQIFDLEAKYQAKEKQKQIELLAANNDLYKVKLKQEKLEKLVILGGAFIGLLFLLFLVITYFKVREKNRIIEKALKQKDILLKEIHHRVKNNLQLITSLLNLQSRYIKDEKAKQVSLDGKNRVRSMSLIHQFLYQNKDLTNLSLDEYFKKLVTELFEAYRITDEKIKVNFNIEKTELDIDRVIPLGLIFNELMTNILKYAFPNNLKGQIDIELYKENKQLILKVRDNGIGFDVENDLSQDKTFGFTLINALLQKWKGKFEIKSREGTQAVIIIPDIN